MTWLRLDDRRRRLGYQAECDRCGELHITPNVTVDGELCLDCAYDEHGDVA